MFLDDFSLRTRFVLVSLVYKLVIYTVSQKNCTLLFLQYLCQTKLYFDNFWHMYTLINLEQNNTKIVNLS